MLWRDNATRNQGAQEPGISVLSLVARFLLLRQELLGAILGESEASLVTGIEERKLEEP